MDNLFYKYFLLGLIILSFVLNPFAKKQASKNLKSSEYFLVNQIIIVTLVIFYSIYLFYNNHCDINCIKKMSSKEIMWSVFAGFIGIIGSVALIAVIQLDEITFIMPNIQPIVILIGAVLGYYVFNESMGTYKMIGIILIILGAFCVNYDKFKNNSITKKVK